MKKVIIIITSVVVGLFILINIPINLHNNKYYYATHMPHNRNQYPLIPTLIGSSKFPSKYIKGYQVENTGSTRGPIINQISKEKIATRHDAFKVDNYGSFNYPDKDNSYRYYGYVSSPNGTLSKPLQDGKNISKQSKNLVFKEMDTITENVRKSIPSPRINLQWIWNIWFKIHYR
ncbi:hypothetical protein H5S11_02165 [Limosilactobacillus sp. pH52_RY]|uniref:hypothetical protein n=1 Tax=Limosilactobacillus balticus TaxID=2759747 RepID=UPI0015FDC363|nr:hypothetical protein [Limosilactobacillus balticus]MBB1109293.1 hypothetical protein [Limosilactobacillus balticus]